MSLLIIKLIGRWKTLKYNLYFDQSKLGAEKAKILKIRSIVLSSIFVEVFLRLFLKRLIKEVNTTCNMLYILTTKQVLCTFFTRQNLVFHFVASFAFLSHFEARKKNTGKQGKKKKNMRKLGKLRKSLFPKVGWQLNVSLAL